MFAAVTSVAAASGPGDAALAFLEQVRCRQVNLESGGDTAIAPETSRAKRREISRRLERIASDIGTSDLELGPVRTDGELAAVLVRRTPGFDPTSLHVFPVALVRRDDRWVPTPLPASFENCGLQARPELRGKIKALEGWLLRTRSLDLLALRDEATARIRRKIESGLPLATLRAMDSQQVAQSFLDACERGDLAVIVGLLGGLSENQPSNLRERIRICEEMLPSASPAIRPWRLLCSPEVLRAMVHHEEDRKSALVSIGCLDPRLKVAKPGSSRIEIVHLELTRGSDGIWRVDPGEAFWTPGEEAPEPDPEGDDPVLDGDLLDLFPGRLIAKHPPRPTATAAEAEAATLAAIRSAVPGALVAAARIDPNPGIARMALGRLARMWATSHGAAASSHLIPLERLEKPGMSVVFLQLLSPREPDVFRPVSLYFARGDDGWLWVPDSEEGRRTFGTWIDGQEEAWPSTWRDKLLAATYRIDKLPSLDPPSEEQARETVRAWHADLRQGDLQTALGRCARLFGDAGRDDLLRRAAMEIDDVRHDGGKLEIGTATRGQMVTLVAATIPREASASQPLYPVISTAAGPRILLDLELFAGDSRTRQFLNRTVIDRVRRIHPEAADDIAGLMPKPAPRSADRE